MKRKPLIYEDVHPILLFTIKHFVFCLFIYQLIIIGPRHSFSSITREPIGLEYRHKSNIKGPMILYPDIYQIGEYGNCKYTSSDEKDKFNGAQNKNRGISSKSSQCNNDDTRDVCQQCILSIVASVLPLAKAMGAKVTRHLHEKVTHLLCDITCDKLQWHPSISMSIFQDYKRGFSLHQRLVGMNSDVSINIMLVSPRWIRNNWS